MYSNNGARQGWLTGPLGGALGGLMGGGFNGVNHNQAMNNAMLSTAQHFPHFITLLFCFFRYVHLLFCFCFNFSIILDLMCTLMADTCCFHRLSSNQRQLIPQTVRTCSVYVSKSIQLPVNYTPFLHAIYTRH